MAVQHVITAGETVIALSVRYGHSAETIWNDAANDELRKTRSYMNTLLPDDVVSIPDLRPKQVAAATGRVHRFRRVGIPAVLRLRMLDGGLPRAEQDYELQVDAATFEGKTDADGVLQHYVPPEAEVGRIVIGPDEYTVDFVIGYLHPLNTSSGARQRLWNLGYLTDPPAEGDEDAVTRAALSAFQADYGLAASGELDAETQEALETAHDVAEAE